MTFPKIPKYFSRQAQVAMLGYLVLAVAILLPINLNIKEYNLSERVLSLLMMLMPMIVSVYTINCLVTGSSKGGMPCDVLAWLNSGSILVWSILVLILTLLMYSGTGVVSNNMVLKNNNPTTSEKPTPVVEKPAPVVEQPAPVVEQPTPVVEQPTPVVEQPTPAPVKMNGVPGNGNDVMYAAI